MNINDFVITAVTFFALGMGSGFLLYALVMKLKLLSAFIRKRPKYLKPTRL